MSSKQLTILQMNDSHGYLDLHQELFWAGDHADYRMAGGHGRVAALLKSIRAENPGRVLAFDCGDTIHGTYPAVQTEGQALVPILNAMGFDAMTAHWEFAYGPARFQEIVRQIDYPMLAVNCYDEETDELAFDPYLVTEAAGLRVGVLGTAATIVDKVMPASFSEGVYFTLGNEELPGYIDTLRNVHAPPPLPGPGGAYGQFAAPEPAGPDRRPAGLLQRLALRGAHPRRPGDAE